MSEISLRNPDNLNQFTTLINSIITRCNGIISLERLNTVFMNDTNSTIKSWFVNGKKNSIHTILQSMFSENLVFDTVSHKPAVIVSFKKDVTESEMLVDVVPHKSARECVEKIELNIKKMNGSNQNLAITVDDDDDDVSDIENKDDDNHDVNIGNSVTKSKSWKDISWKLNSNRSVSDNGVVNIEDAVENFQMYRDYQLIHVTYSKLRIVVMCRSLNRSNFDIQNFRDLFQGFFRENFLSGNVLKHFISEGEKSNRNDTIIKFLKRFCGDLLDISKSEEKIQVTGDIHSLYLRYNNELLKLIEKLEPPVSPILSGNGPTPVEMSLLGKVHENNNHVDIRIMRDYKGNSTHLLNFPGTNANRVLGGKHRPTIDEINQRVVTIRNKICREGNAVKMVDIVRDLCHFYQVSCVQDLCPCDFRPLRRDADIPAIYEISRNQGKINAFIQAFVTFRNICTLYELNEEVCKLESKATFSEYKLGPLQKQLLVYEFFGFPPTQTTIPTITTMDVFKLLWKYQSELHKQSTKSNTLKKEKAKEKIKFEDFMAYFIKEYGFETPFESGVRISSIALAIQVVRKAWFGDMHAIKDVSRDFNKQLCQELKQHLHHASEAISNRFVIISTNNGIDYNDYIPKIAGMPIADGFLELFAMIRKLKHEAAKRLPGTCQIMDFAEIVENTLSLIKKDKTLTQIFHILLSTAPLRRLEKNDIKVLKYLGFEKVIQEIIETEEKKAEERNERTKIERPAPEKKSLVTKTTKKWLEKHRNIDIKSLAKIEYQITAELQPNYEGFVDLGHGSFLNYICTDQYLLDIVVSNMSDTMATRDANTTCNNDLIEFIDQCYDISNPKDILTSISNQFLLSSGNIKFINNYIQQSDKQKQNHNKSSHVIYEQCLLYGTEYYGKDNQQQNDIKQLAKQSIMATPYLEGIEQWTSWNTIFNQCCGNLKTFIKEEFRTEEIKFIIMEVSPGNHLKLMVDCSEEVFTRSIKHLDSEIAANCIVSSIYTSSHVKNASIALLGNKIQSMFLESSKNHIMKEEDEYLGANDDIVRFTLECFQLIPFKILSFVATKLFLAPLSTIYGSTNVSSVLLKGCKNLQQQQILHALGLHLSDSIWINDFSKTLESRCKYNDGLLIKYEDVEDGETEENVNNLENDVQICSGGESMEVDTIKHDKEKDESDEIPLQKTNCNISNAADKERLSDLDNGDCEGVSLSNIHTGDASSKPELNIDHCYEIVQKIRREQFGIGVEFGEEQMKLIQVHREREGRSLDRLSKELYTRDSHFVLELIQNADDNEYNIDSFNENENATVAFIVEEEKITILNNEKGFMDKNIRALCDVGKSTKGIHRKGYIGQKGIGFKSVFRVTDCPEIHSNGFHIKFDASTGPNGYILPVWIDNWEETNQQLLAVPDKINYNWTTQIVLPLKKEMQHTKLTSRFRDVHPSLLMFLNRLHKIIIDDKVSGTLTIMEKSFINNNIIQLSTNAESKLWFVTSKEITMKLSDEAKPTDISVAFPISEKNLELQPVFAFLPLRSYGFKFVIQADFEVPSSREDIDKDSAWNQSILQYIPSLVVESFYEFKKHCHFQGLEGVLEYFRFLDVDNHVQGVFQQVAKNIIKLLQKEKCLPISFGGDGNSNTISMVVDKENTVSGVGVSAAERSVYQWALPTSIVMSKQNISETISSNMLKEYLGLTYLQEKVQHRLSCGILKLLGVSSISLEQLIDVVKSHMKHLHDNSQQHNKSLLLWIGKWLLLVYSTLQETCDFTESSLDKIRELVIFPLSDGRFVSLKEKVVFLPVDESYKQKKKLKGGKKTSLHVIEKDLDILCRSLLETFTDQLEQDQVVRLLKDLGLKTIQAKDLIQDHIIPLFKTGLWKVKKENLVIASVKYMLEQYQLDADSVNMKEMKSYLVLFTNQGFKEIQKDVVYIPSLYGNPINLEKDLATCDWLLVSKKYAEHCTDQDIKTWFSFFRELGLNTFARFRREKITLHLTDIKDSIWKNYCETWPRTADDTYVINDVTCPEYNSLLKNGSNVKEIKLFTSLLNRDWNTEYKKYDISKQNCIVNNNEGNFVTNTFSSLFIKMCSSAWLTSTSKSSQLFKPRDLFIESETFLSTLSNKVNYVAKEIDNQDLILTLGCQTDLSFNTFFTEFKKWVEAGSFTTSKRHVLDIYKYLSTLRIQELEQVKFYAKAEPFFFFPTKNRNQNSDTDNESVTGKFYKFQHVCWVDPSNLFTRINHDLISRRILKGFYTDSLQAFFVNTLQVDYYPSGEEYLKLVCNLASMTSLPDSEECKKIYSLLSVLGETLLKGERAEELKGLLYPEQLDNQTSLYNDLNQYIDETAFYSLKNARISELNIFPTVRNVFTCLANAPIVVFNKELSKPFENECSLPLLFPNEIHRLIKPKPSFNRSFRDDNTDYKFLCLLVFFKACEMPALKSIYIEPENVTELISRGCHKWEEVLHKITPVIQRFIKSKIPELYNILQTDNGNFKNYLYTSRFFTVEKLEVIYRLRGRNDVNVKQVKISNVERCEEKAIIYITKAKMENNFDDIIKEVITLFTRDNDRYREEILDFVLDFIAVPDKDSYLRRKKLSMITDLNELWEFPKPVQSKSVPAKPVVDLPTVENKTEAAENTEETRLTCWPPRSGGSGGQSGKSEAVKEEEKRILEKWKRPDAPDLVKAEETGNPVREMAIVNTEGTLSGDGIKRKREPSEQSNQSTDDTESLSKPKSKKTFVDSQLSPNTQSGTYSGTECQKNSSNAITLPGTTPSFGKPIFNANSFSNEPLIDQYEDLPISIDLQTETTEMESMQAQDDNDDSPGDQSDKTGEDGEKIVYRHLLKQHADEITQGKIEVDWMNKDKETGEPFDIRITSRDDGGLTSHIYIEVKSSMFGDRKPFEISSQQIKFAFKHTHSFHLYRVTGLARNEKVLVKRLVNLSSYLDNKSVKLFMLL